MDAFAQALASGSTRLARLFRVERRDGMVLGFTDHDRDITRDGVIFRAAAALTASESAAVLGLAPDELDAAGALSDDAITEADLAAGAYDAAEVEMWEADWSAPAVARLIGRFTIGEVVRGPVAFTAELRGITAALARPQGRVHSNMCDVARLGDARCRLDLDAGGWRLAGTVEAVHELEVALSGIDVEGGFFNRGLLRFTSGAVTGAEIDIRLSQREGSALRLSLWRVLPEGVAVGDAVEVEAGCDRSFLMCRDRFANQLNFRGFPLMPEESFAGEYAVTGEPDQDGGSRFG
ncbi:putative phage protein (TIGR02218 family) [Roseovarius sp. MBR-154]|jgi:uncharacterized phage protein (TIGR02218 family)